MARTVKKTAKKAASSSRQASADILGSTCTVTWESRRRGSYVPSGNRRLTMFQARRGRQSYRQMRRRSRRRGRRKCRAAPRRFRRWARRRPPRSSRACCDLGSLANWNTD